MNKKNDYQLVNPFSEKFFEIWNLYKDYRKEVHKFKFVGVISEQMALKKLVEVSGGDEERAIRIVEQTIASGKWMGFYPLKTTTYKDGTRKQSTPKAGQQQPTTNTEKFKQGFMRRNTNGEQEGDGTHLKAV